MAISNQAVLSQYDAAPMGPRYWLVFGLLCLLLIFELFDFFIAGFLMSAIAPSWKLTFFQSAVMLLSTGIGAMVGAATLGKLADRLGRKVVIVSGGLLCSVSSAAVAFVPDHQWPLFSLLRFLVGVGYGAAGIAQFSLIIEITPTRSRTFLSSAAAISPAVGLICASFIAARLFALVGWRGLALASGVPLFLVLIIWAVIPESFRWLLARGQVARASKSISWLLNRPVAAFDDSQPGRAAAMADAPVPLSQLYREPRKFWLILLCYFAAATGSTGVYLWGPTITAQLLDLTPGAAAGYFSMVGIAGLLGRISMTFAAARFGRKPTAVLASFAGGICLTGAGLLHASFFGAASLFLVCLVVGALFYDGAFANLQPYAGELYPVRLTGRALGLSQIGSGAGKLAGPVILALLAGSTNFVTPQAMGAAVRPGFLALGVILVCGGLVMLFIGQETHGKPLAVDFDPEEVAASQVTVG